MTPRRPSDRSAPGRAAASALLLVFLGAGCGAATTPPGGASSTPSGARKTVPALKLAVLDAVGGRLSYCDPDLFPVAHGEPVSNARERLPMIESDQEAFRAILEHEELAAGQSLGPDQLVAISETYKQMQAIELEPAGNLYRFTVSIPKDGSETVERVRGTVDRAGSVHIEDREPGVRPNCPICLAEASRIATPSGDVAVEEIRVGMHAWTTDVLGRRIIGVVLRTGRSVAPPGHQVVRLSLADGRTVSASPRHPTADGREVGDLRAGDPYDGSRVIEARLVPYTAGATYDLLPSGPTGTYFANGVVLGSTLMSPSRS